jgi:hypothetical protein
MSPDVLGVVRGLMTHKTLNKEADIRFACRRLLGIPTEHTPAADLQWAIVKWALKHHILIDMGFYSHDAWIYRGETYGKDSEFTITAEGAPLYVLYYDGDSKALVEFENLVLRYGFRFEMGYHWSFHFYKKEKT